MSFENREIENILKEFVALISKQKNLIFPVSDIEVSKLLFKEKIVKEENGYIKILNYEKVSIYFLNYYKELFDFEINNDFSKSVDFINRIESDFKQDGLVNNFFLLEKEIWKAIILESNILFKCSFNDYLKSIDYENKPDELYNFINAYSVVLPKLNLSEDLILENVLILVDLTKSNADYNVDLGQVLNSIRNKCLIDYKSGIQLLNKSLLFDVEKDNIISSIISGLYENKKNEFYELALDELIKNKTKLAAIFFGLSSISNVDENDCKLFINLVKLHPEDEALNISKISLIFSILNSGNTKFSGFCFEYLNIEIKKESSAYFILGNLTKVENYHSEKTELIINLVTQNYFDIDKYVQPVSRVFWRMKEFECLKTVIINIATIKPFKKFLKAFHSQFSFYDRKHIDKFIIELLTNNKAHKRTLGIELFDLLGKHQSSFRFEYDILEEPTIIQYKLWVSLTDNFNQPTDRLVALIPLIDSKSEIIRESFICKLEEISEDYGGLITEILENNLDSTKKEYAIIINRIKNYIEDYYSRNADIKRNILELNPYQTHFKYINQFNELFSKKMSNTIEKSAREDSLLSIFGTNTVQLSKGGGWKFGDKKEISQLGKFGSSFSMPRSYFINPNQFDMEKGMIMMTDWTKEEFSTIEQMLKNEQ
ncbi:hypothetical protein BN1195_02400 [Chryseobacterium oranimense G311]|uniref:hypothetical protein n=1 Tax=Chryseobacterium oranimense TaxID=421058 RepID=UPI0005336FB8|nr:hypothetical protein [Chryseobacterium oranimense]CEJ70096.1 hypothetical protein BN1195_02400 [Chryseobacterium oranimense G311]